MSRIKRDYNSLTHKFNFEIKYQGQHIRGEMSAQDASDVILKLLDQYPGCKGQVRSQGGRRA